MLETKRALTEGKTVVLDDFPLSWLLTPLEQRDFRRHPKDNFPGAADFVTLEEKNLFCDVLEKMTGIKFQRAPLQLRLRRSDPEDVSKSFIHYDLTDFAGVLYLSDLPNGVDAQDFGTHFYRHRIKGWDRLPSNDKSKVTGVFIISEQTRDLGAWEIINRIPFKKNRLVLYPGSLFHSPPISFLEGHSLYHRTTLDLFGKMEQENQV